MDQLLTPCEAAAVSGVDQKTLARFAQAGILPSVRTLGGHNRYRAADLRRLPRPNRWRRDRG